MLQTILVIMIVGLAAAYAAWKFYRSFKGQSGCGCGCSGCADKSACESSDNNLL